MSCDVVVDEEEAGKENWAIQAFSLFSLSAEHWNTCRA